MLPLKSLKPSSTSKIVPRVLEEDSQNSSPECNFLASSKAKSRVSKKKILKHSLKQTDSVQKQLKTIEPQEFSKDLSSSEENRPEKESLDLSKPTDANEDICFSCRQGGDLLICDNCFKSFHQTCINLKKVPSGTWMCPHCEIPDKRKCKVCSQPTRANAILFTCSICYGVLEGSCVKTPLKVVLNSFFNREYCLDEQTNNLLD